MFNIKIVRDDGKVYLKINMGITYYYGIIKSSVFPDELYNSIESIINESIEYYCKSSNKNPQIMSKLEFSNSSEENNFLISFSLVNDYVKIQKIIKIELKKFNKTIENIINDLAEKTNELEDNGNKLQNQIKILEEKNSTFEILLKKQELTFNDEIKSLRDIITELQTKLNKPTDFTQSNFKSNLPNFTQPNFTQQNFTQPKVNNIFHQNPAIDNTQAPISVPIIPPPISVANPAFPPALTQSNFVLAQNVPTFKFGMP